MKICSKCGVEKPATEEYFYKMKECKDGYRGSCKMCKTEYDKEYRDKKAVAVSETKKKCYQAKKQEYLGKHKKYYQANKEAIIDYQKKYRDDNKTRLSYYIKGYYKNNEDRLVEYQKEYQRDNKDTIIQKHLLWCKLNGDRICISRNKRRAIKKQLPHTLTLEQWNKCKKHFNHTCAYCGRPVNLAQEHFIPLSKGGEYTHNNIIPACINCNSSKGDRDFNRWYPRQPFYDRKRELKILKYLNYKNSIQQLSIL